MKARFTNSAKKAFLSFFIMSIAALGDLQAQNSVYSFDNQNNANGSPSQMMAGSPGTGMRIVLDQNSTAGTKIVSAKLILSDKHQDINGTGNMDVALNFDSSSVDPESLQFDLGQSDLSQLYKLLALYKSEAGKGGHTIVTLSRKNQSGQSGKAVDSIFIVFKYVVADDVLGIYPPVTGPQPGFVIGAKISNISNRGSLDINANASLQTAQIKVMAQPVLSDIISLYPNPAQNSITVDLNAYTGSDIRIYNIQGKLVKTVPSLLNVLKHKIDIADLPSGFYILSIDTPNGAVQKKFSKIN